MLPSINLYYINLSFIGYPKALLMVTSSIIQYSKTLLIEFHQNRILMMYVDKHAPTLGVYFRNFIRIFWSTFPIKFPLFSQKYRLIGRIRTYSLRHESAMRPPHACYVIQARDGRSD